MHIYKAHVLFVPSAAPVCFIDNEGVKHLVQELLVCNDSIETRPSHSSKITHACSRISQHLNP